MHHSSGDNPAPGRTGSKSSTMESVVDRLFALGSEPVPDEVDRAIERRQQVVLSRLIRAMLDAEDSKTERAA